MTAENREPAIKITLGWEGGYTNNPHDPGGPTNWGITITDARKYWKPDADADDVKAMPLEVAVDIFRQRYWDVLKCDDLPAGVDLVVFDYGVNSGVSRSAKVLQRFVGVDDDGHIGPLTIAAVKLHDADLLINDICDERLAFLQRLPTWGEFGKGWGKRVFGIKEKALAMAGEVT